MSDEGDFRIAIQHVRETTSRMRHPGKLPLSQKGHMPPRKNAKDSTKVDEES